MANVVIEGQGELPALPKVDSQANLLVFAEPECIGHAIDLVASQTRRHVLCVHNGDHVPIDKLQEAGDAYKHTYSVNWLGEHDRITALPVGLENAWHGRNGVIQSFSDCLPARRHSLPSVDDRTTQILNCFDISTNPQVRSSAHETFKLCDNTVTPAGRLTNTDFTGHLLNSLFVVSPPGNGYDCHRTWEAIYRGAVPIVLRQYWPFKDLTLPVLVADSWEEAARAVMLDAPALYLEVISAPLRNAFADSWITRIQGELGSEDSRAPQDSTNAPAGTTA